MEKDALALFIKILPYLIPLIAVFISLIAIHISRNALKEAKLANTLSINPLITIQCPSTFKGNELPVIIENAGKVDVEKISIIWFTRQEDLTDKEEKRQGGSHPIMETFEKPFPAEQKISFKLYLKEQIEAKERDKKGNIIILVIRAKYKRTADAKSFENQFNFMLSLHPFGVSVENLSNLREIESLQKEVDKIIQ